MTPVISQYDNVYDLTGKEIPIDLFFDRIREGHWQDLVLPIRAMISKEERTAAKLKMPNVSLSGKFKTRQDQDIVNHSGFIGIDIDDVDPEFTKSILCPDKYIYGAFTSISGRGLCVVFKINGEKHREAFAGISEYLLNNYQLVIDPTSVNPSRARFVSFDPFLYLNEDAPKFTLYPKVKDPKKVDRIIFVQNDFEEMLNEVARRGVNLAENYHEWLRIAYALADKFGETGRKYFHHISQFSTKYKTEICDRQYTACLKRSSSGKTATIGTLYYYIKNAGVPLYSQETKTIAIAAGQARKGGRTKEQAIDNLEKFEGISRETSTDIVNQVFDNRVDIDSEETLFDLVEVWLRHNYDFRRNTITRYIENRGKVLHQKDLNTIYIAAKKVFDKINFENIDRIINSDFVPDYNPLMDFFNTHKEHTPTGQIDRLFSTIKTDNSSHVLHFGKKWLVGMIAGVFGEHNPLMLVLTGELQGTGKTEFFRRMLPKELRPYSAESKLDAGKDDEILMTQKMLIGDDEMSGKSKKEEKKMKELLSKQVFSLREPYGRNNVDLLRIATLWGTTNDKNILNDTTGNRRIIPVNVIDIDKEAYNKIDKTEVLIEAYHLYKSNWDWRLSRQDIQMLGSNTGDFENYSLEYELVAKYFKKPTTSYNIEFLTASEIKVEVEKLSNQKLSLDRLGKELKRFGFEQNSKCINSINRKRYAVQRISYVFGPNAPSNEETDTVTMNFNAGSEWKSNELPF